METTSIKRLLGRGTLVPWVRLIGLKAPPAITLCAVRSLASSALQRRWLLFDFI